MTWNRLAAFKNIQTDFSGQIFRELLKFKNRSDLLAYTVKTEIFFGNRPIHSVTFSASSGDQLEYNGSQGANGSD